MAIFQEDPAHRIFDYSKNQKQHCIALCFTWEILYTQRWAEDLKQSVATLCKALYSKEYQFAKSDITQFQYYGMPVFGPLGFSWPRPNKKK